MTDPGAELVEVVDETGAVVEIVTRAEMRAQRLRHRTVFIAVVDPGGSRLLVHRRADWKDVWPSRWDLAFGGVVAVGEGWDDAAVRELAEEAGLVADLEHLGSESYDDTDVRELSEIYLARSEGPFSFPDGEVAEVAWADLSEIDAWLADRAVCPDTVALVLPRVRGL
jgi:isopentenyldiphosphate isomerase